MRDEHEGDVVRQARAVEWLKAELAGALASAYRALLQGREETVLDALGDLLVATYLLGRRTGIPFALLDGKASARLRASVRDGHELERWYGDLSALAHHLDGRRESEA